ncbi:MAG: transcriptional regulator [Burkholderiaceae bacterium]|nr:transcriptional regulator [Burkholderiaceae bacterium]
MDERRLLADGRPVPLGGRAFDLLCVLAEHADRVVSKDELFARVWPGLVVEDNNLTVQVSALRRVLGTGAITNLPGRGYRLVLSVQLASDDALPAAMAPQWRQRLLPLQRHPWLHFRVSMSACVWRQCPPVCGWRCRPRQMRARCWRCPAAPNCTVASLWPRRPVRDRGCAVSPTCGPRSTAPPHCTPDHPVVGGWRCCRPTPWMPPPPWRWRHRRRPAPRCCPRAWRRLSSLKWMVNSARQAATIGHLTAWPHVAFCSPHPCRCRRHPCSRPLWNG